MARKPARISAEEAERREGLRPCVDCGCAIYRARHVPRETSRCIACQRIANHENEES